jgi:hypothetical protein
VYTEQDKVFREGHLDQFLCTLESIEEQRSLREGKHSDTEETLFSAFRTLLGSALDVKDEHLDIIFSHPFKNATREFVQTARRFDPSVGFGDIFQACRNLWVMTGLQQMLGRPVELTPAVFAYSMLYPYTDNYLDNPDVPMETKASFNERLEKRLAGEPIVPANAHERIIFRLVGMIESQYERTSYPDVFDGLLAIHHAQKKSLCLLDPRIRLSEADVLEISFEKGGASVLADGYLVSGFLTEFQGRSLFGYGVYLQLVDDLQDVQDDSHAGLSTVFSQASGHTPLDRLTSRTYHFGTTVMERLHSFEGHNVSSFVDLMTRTTVMQLIEGAGLADKLHSESYVRRLEAYSPFRFSCVKKHRYSPSPYRKSLLRLLEELSATDGSGSLDVP